MEPAIMAKRHGGDSAGTGKKPQERGTASVQIERELAKMAKVVAAHEGKSVSDLLSPQLRAFLRAQYARVQKEMGEELR